MSQKTVPEAVKVIVYGAKSLKARKKDHKFSVIFGIGQHKFRTDVVEDLFGNPTFNTESEIPVEDASQPLVFVVTEKKEKDVLGQITVPLCDLLTYCTNNPDKIALQPHKKCSEPEGELIFEAWISSGNSGILPVVTISNVEEEKKTTPVQSGLRKIRNKLTHSPILSKKPPTGGDRRYSESLFSLKTKSSYSCQDVSGGTPMAFPFPRDNPRLLPADSLSSIDSSSDAVIEANRPEITGVSPKEASVVGGSRVTIRGSNLGRNKDDVVGLFLCGANVLASLEYVTSSKLVCTTKAWKACAGNVVVETQSGGRGTSLVEFVFRDENGGNPTKENSDADSISSAEFSRGSSQRSNPDKTRDGNGSFKGHRKATSMFDLSFHSNKPPKPEVTGISPREGPVEGGTRLTIRGENLGQNIDDIVSVTLCGINCIETVEYESSSKLIFISKPWKAGTGNVIVETRSGGVGTSLVNYTYVEKEACVPPMPEKHHESNLPTLSLTNDPLPTIVSSEDESANDANDPPARSKSPSVGGSQGSSGKLPPRVVEIQPMRKPPPSPSRLPVKPPRKHELEENKLDIIESEQDVTERPHSVNRSVSLEDYTVMRSRITELETLLSSREEQIKQLQEDNKLYREEVERMRTYMQSLVSRAILSCPQILCVDQRY